MYLKQMHTWVYNVLAPLAIYIVSGFCFLLSIGSFSVYAEQEWRILLLPAQVNHSYQQDDKVLNDKLNQVSENVDSTVSPNLLTEYKPFDYGVLQSQITVSKINKSSQPQTLPSSILFNESVEQAIASQLISANYEVLDKTLLLQLANEQQTLKQLNENSKSDTFDLHQYSSQEIEYLQNTANLMVRYQLAIERQATKTTPTWKLTLSAVVLDVLSKKQIESHQEVFSVSGIPVGCLAVCEQQWFVPHIQKVARDTGAVLVEKLIHLPRRYYYTLRFNAFERSELHLLQQLLSEQNSKVFSEVFGGSDYSVLNKSPHSNQHDLINIREPSLQYRYVSLLPSDQLDQLFNAFFLEQKWQVHTRYETGNVFHFTRQTHTPLTLTLYASIVLFLLVVAIVLLIVWFNKYTNTRLASKQAILQQATFDRKASSLIDILKTRIEPYEALSLIDEFLIFSQAYKNECLHANQADSFYKKELKKNTQFYQKLTTIRERYCENITPLSGSLLTDHYYIFPLNENTQVHLGRFNHKSNNNALKNTNEHVSEGLADTDYFLHLSYQVLPVSDSAHQALSFSYHHKHLYVTSSFVLDKGYSCQLNYQELPLHVPERLFMKKSVDLLSLGVSQKNQDIDSSLITTPCTFQLLQRDNNVLLTLDSTINQLYETKNLVKRWPEWSIDLAKKWILQTERLAIGINHTNDIVLGCFNGEKPLLWLYYEPNMNKSSQQYFIERVNDVSEHVNETLAENVPLIFINGYGLYGKIPLAQHAVITFKETLTHQKLQFTSHSRL